MSFYYCGKIHNYYYKFSWLMSNLFYIGTTYRWLFHQSAGVTVGRDCVVRTRRRYRYSYHIGTFSLDVFMPHERERE